MIEARSHQGPTPAPPEQQFRTQTGLKGQPPSHASPPGAAAGFSLTELMLTLLIAVTIYGGVAATFSEMRKGATDQSRSSALSGSIRGVNVQMQHDFANAGRGLWDLSAFNIRYNFSDSFVAGAQPRYFHGVTDHDVEDISGQSTIIVQWFDYDVIGGNESKSPTFLFDLGVGEDFPAGGLFTTANFIGPTAYLQTVEPGDIFVIYNNAARTTTSAYTDIEGEGTLAVWNHEQVGGAVDPLNTAVLLEVSEVSPVEAVGSADYGNLQQITVNFAETGDSYFSPDMEGDSISFPFSRPAEAGDPRLLDNTMFARKLGSRDDFHRVRYIIDNTGTYPTLMRIHNNDDPEVLMTNVTDFSIFLGLDVAPNIPPNSVQINHMDGTLSATDPAAWAYEAADFGVSYDDYQTLLGRHALAANVLITAESTAETSDGRLPTKSFNSRFRIANTVPLPFYNKANNIAAE
ncbi:PilW family protein [Acanthopleuribacter pedis]|uniref:Uncharacterized protein n=1 Tax=Acanthopleuribacter pedis TaxID=442870 RepID=A0A8J7Q935_9BACT|nr:hypothetical protein [Acanthopleuribacter pedis]MBO1320851.1 hypothetical protein [Acanthopleuribacter pedis]